MCRLATSCCSCCSLATGTRVIGHISMLHAFALFGMGIFFLKQSAKQFGTHIFDYSEDEVIIPFQHADPAHLMGWKCVIDAFLIFVVSTVLLVGVNQKQEKFFLPWLAFHTFFLLLIFQSLAYRIILDNIHPLLLFIKFLFSTMMAYFYFIVLSYFKFLRNARNGQVVVQQTVGFSQPSMTSPVGYATVTMDAKTHMYTHLPPPPQTMPPNNPQTIPPNPPSYSLPPPYSEVV